VAPAVSGRDGAGGRGGGGRDGGGGGGGVDGGELLVQTSSEQLGWLRGARRASRPSDLVFFSEYFESGDCEGEWFQIDNLYLQVPDQRDTTGLLRAQLGRCSPSGCPYDASGNYVPEEVLATAEVRVRYVRPEPGTQARGSRRRRCRLPLARALCSAVSLFDRDARAFAEALFAGPHGPPPDERLRWLVADLADFLEQSGPRAWAVITGGLEVATWLAPPLIGKLPPLSRLSIEERCRALDKLEHSPPGCPCSP
jgi:hypothetical protein